MYKWITLFNYAGESIQNPSLNFLKLAIVEVFSAKDIEHPDIWIECGRTSGGLDVFSVDYLGNGRYICYEDEEMEIEIKSQVIPMLNTETAFEFMKKPFSTINKLN